MEKGKSNYVIKLIFLDWFNDYCRFSHNSSGLKLVWVSVTVCMLLYSCTLMLLSTYKLNEIRLQACRERRGEVTKAEGPHGEQRHVGTQCLFVNPCAQSRNTLIGSLVRDTADSCKHRSDTLGTLRHNVHGTPHASSKQHNKAIFSFCMNLPEYGALIKH